MEFIDRCQRLKALYSFIKEGNQLHKNILNIFVQSIVKHKRARATHTRTRARTHTTPHHTTPHHTTPHHTTPLHTHTHTHTHARARTTHAHTTHISHNTLCASILQAIDSVLSLVLGLERLNTSDLTSHNSYL